MTVGSVSNRELTRRRREDRVDHVHDIPFNERATVECPNCEESIETAIYSSNWERSYDSCWSWDCDAYHKFRRDRDAETSAEPSKPIQTGLQNFAGGDA